MADPSTWIRNIVEDARDARGYGEIEVETSAPQHRHKLEPGTKHPPLPRTDGPSETMNDIIRAGKYGVSPADVKHRREAELYHELRRPRSE